MKTKCFLGLALLLGGMALCGAGLWLLLSPPQYAATARIKVEQDNENGDYSYDPYFVQTSFEIMQSQLVLSNVVAHLNLQMVWGKKFSHGTPLTTTECVRIINNHIRFAPVRDTKFIDITYYSDDPKEAADVANAVGVSYKEYRIQSLNETTAKGLEILQQQFQDEEKQILVLQTNVEQLRQKFAIQDGAANNQSSEQQPYWEAKKELDSLTDLHKLFATKIEAIKLVEPIPKTMMVQFIHQAEPPQLSVSTNRPLGAALLAVGLFLLLGGILLLKSQP